MLKGEKHMLCFKNGKAIKDINVADRAFQYGDGCFTTISVKNGCLNLWHHHYARLQNATQRLFLQVDWQLIEQAEQFWQKYSHENHGTFKILISRGVGQRGYGFSETPADVYFFLYPTAQLSCAYLHIKAGVLTQKLGLTMPHLVGIKSLNRLEQVILKQEAQQKNYKEAFVFNVADELVEGVSSNCFIYINQQWYTPTLRQSGIHGVMRKEILVRMKQFGINCTEKVLTRSDLQQAEAAFFCNALHPVQAVSQIDHLMLNCDITQQLFNALTLDCPL